MSPRYFASCDDPFRAEFEGGWWSLCAAAARPISGAPAAAEISRSERHSHKVGRYCALASFGMTAALWCSAVLELMRN